MTGDTPAGDAEVEALAKAKAEEFAMSLIFIPGVRAALDSLPPDDPVAPYAALYDRMKAETAKLRERVAELEAEVRRVQSDRQYIIGWNDGWAEAIKQNLRFPTMLRKMWAGHEVQQWIHDQMADANRAQSALESSPAILADATNQKATP